MKHGDNTAGFAVLVHDRNSGELELPFAIRRRYFRDPRSGLIQGGSNWLDHVAVANDIEQGCSGRDARLAVQLLESRIAHQNVLGGVDHQQTVGQRGQDSTDFSCVLRNLAVELALAGQQSFQGQPDPAGPGDAAEEKGRRLCAAPNTRYELITLPRAPKRKSL